MSYQYNIRTIILVGQTRLISSWSDTAATTSAIATPDLSNTSKFNRIKRQREYYEFHSLSLPLCYFLKILVTILP